MWWQWVIPCPEISAIMYLSFLEKRNYAKFLGTLGSRRVAWELLLLLAVFEETKRNFILGLGGRFFMFDTIGMAKWERKNKLDCSALQSRISPLQSLCCKPDLMIPLPLKYDAVNTVFTEIYWTSVEIQTKVCESLNLYSLYLYLRLLMPVTATQLLLSKNAATCFLFLVWGWYRFPNWWVELVIRLRLESYQGEDF